MPTGLVRYQQSGGFHFLTFSCYRRRPLLQQTKGYDIFEQELESLRIQYRFIIAGYVLMPEHVHLLVNEPTVKPLSTVIQILKQKTSQALKSTIEPQFWQRRYYGFNVRTEEKTAEKLRYIHRNPVIRGLVSNPEDWEWSSYRHYQTGQRSTIEIESHWTAFHREQTSQRRLDHP